MAVLALKCPIRVKNPPKKNSVKNNIWRTVSSYSMDFSSAFHCRNWKLSREREREREKNPFPVRVAESVAPRGFLPTGINDSSLISLQKPKRRKPGVWKRRNHPPNSLQRLTSESLQWPNNNFSPCWLGAGGTQRSKTISCVCSVMKNLRVSPMASLPSSGALWIIEDVSFDSFEREEGGRKEPESVFWFFRNRKASSVGEARRSVGWKPQRGWSGNDFVFDSKAPVKSPRPPPPPLARLSLRLPSSPLFIHPLFHFTRVKHQRAIRKWSD